MNEWQKDRIESLLKERHLDAIMACSSENTFYLTNLPSYPYSTCPVISLLQRASDIPPLITLVYSDSTISLILPDYLIEEAERRSTVDEILAYESGLYLEGLELDREKLAINVFEAMKTALKSRGMLNGTIGLEKSISLYAFRQLQNKYPHVNFVESEQIFNELRVVKTQDEIDLIVKAVNIAEKAFEAAFDIIDVGVTELEVVNKIKKTIMNHGGSWEQTVVSAGANGANLPHLPSNYQIKDGDVTKLDIGAIFEGYCTDIARSVAVGNLDQKVQKIYTAIKTAQEKAVSYIKPSEKLSKIFNIAQETVRNFGFTSYTRKHVGHSLGINVEEPPFITPDSINIFNPNTIFCLEVPYYISHVVGLNVEDMILITDNGYNNLSQKINKEILIK